MVFLVLDLVYFFISFEAVLLPMFFLIGYFGSRNKKLSALYQFFIYTLLGSLFLFISIVLLYYIGGTTEYPLLLSLNIDKSAQYILWLGFFISFAIKVPMVPFHIWLPLAHTEGNTSASVILAAILLKLGTYGFLRFSIPLFPEACEFFLPFVTLLAILGIIYSCISALSLIDLKQVIAYSSIAHMNISIIGIFSNNIHGLVGSYCYSISHGLVSGGLFMLVGVLYDRYHTRTLKYYRGLTFIMPVYITLFLIFTLSNLS
jgi:proton-translocating NADH-quinone oxidoreductase chain M